MMRRGDNERPFLCNAIGPGLGSEDRGIILATKRESSAIFVAEGETDVFAPLFWLGGREHDRPIRLGTFSPFAAASASDPFCRVSLCTKLLLLLVSERCLTAQ